MYNNKLKSAKDKTETLHLMTLYDHPRQLTSAHQYKDPKNCATVQEATGNTSSCPIHE